MNGQTESLAEEQTDTLRDTLMYSAVLFPSAEVHHLRSATEWSDAVERVMSAALENPLPLEVFKVDELVCVRDR